MQKLAKSDVVRNIIIAAQQNNSVTAANMYSLLDAVMQQTNLSKQLAKVYIKNNFAIAADLQAKRNAQFAAHAAKVAKAAAK